MNDVKVYFLQILKGVCFKFVKYVPLTKFTKLRKIGENRLMRLVW